MNFFDNIINVLNMVSEKLSLVGFAVIVLSSILFGVGSMFMDESHETFAKAKKWIMKAIIIGIFIFGAGTIASFVQSLMQQGGFQVGMAIIQSFLG